MPKVDWEGNIGSEDIDEFDRDSQYVPYAGPIPPNGVYAFKLKLLRYSEPAEGQKYPKLQVGLELVPREGRPEDKAYVVNGQGYFIQDWPPIARHTAFRYVPLLDALGVTGKDFVNRLYVDEDGNITRIGKWRNTGDVIIGAGIADDVDDKGNARKKINWYGEIDEDVDEDIEDEEYDDDDLGEDDDDEEDDF